VPSVDGPDRRGYADRAAGPVHAVIAQERIEDAGEAAGEGDDGDGLAAAGRDAQGPGAERGGLGGVATENGDGGLDEEPARAAGAGFGDRAATLGVPGAELAGDKAEVGLDLMSVAEAMDIIQGGDEGRGGDGADTGHGPQARHARIVGGEALDPPIGIGELAVDGQHDREKRGDQRAEFTRQRQGGDALDEAFGAAGGHAIAVLAEQGPDEGDVAGAGADERLTDPRRPRSWRWTSESQWAGR
jgi:hypothetical protein